MSEIVGRITFEPGLLAEEVEATFDPSITREQLNLLIGELSLREINSFILDLNDEMIIHKITHKFADDEANTYGSFRKAEDVAHFYIENGPKIGYLPIVPKDNENVRPHGYKLNDRSLARPKNQPERHISWEEDRVAYGMIRLQQ
ncbi:MAG TPA: hypothetical protein VFN31_02380 [Candidatus Saccharimonadales bacterium]|nr:hypothetical protein [Candidatus Saccharimonadales bacterium]